MEKIIKKIFMIVFSIFVCVTFILFVIQREFSIKYLILSVLVLFGAVVSLQLHMLFKKEINNPVLLLILIAVASLVPRIIWVLLVHVIPQSDFYTYHSLAEALAQGNILYPKFISLFPHVLGYSKVLSLVYTVFGARPETAVIFNIVLNLGILFLLYTLGKLFYDEKTGLIAALIYAFWPSQIFYNALVLTEPFFTFCTLFVIVLYLVIIRNIKKPRCLILSFIGIGVAAGLLKYIRPASVIMLLSIMIHYLFLQQTKTVSNKERNKLYLYKAGLILIILISYSLTSSFILNCIGHRVGFEAAGNSSGFYILVGLSQESEGRWNQEDSSLLDPMISQGMTSENMQKIYSDMGIERLKNMNLLSFIQLQINKNRHMWGNDCKGISYAQNSISNTSHISISKHSKWLIFIADGYYFVFLLLSCAAFYVARGKLATDSYILYLFILGTVAAHMLVEVHSRYHYTAVPLLCVLAAAVFTRNRYTLFRSKSE